MLNVCKTPGERDHGDQAGFFYAEYCKTMLIYRRCTTANITELTDKNAVKECILKVN